MNPKKTSSPAILCTIAIAALFVTSCATSTMDFATGQQTRNFYSVQDDIKMGNQTFEEMKVQMAKDGTAVPSKNAAEVRRVQAIAKRIFAATGQQDTFNFDVELFDSKVVNAFAVPGGKIAVFTGLWDPKEGLVTGDDELAAVIAHETAHVTCRHSTEEMTRQMPSQLLLAAAGLYAESKKDDTWKSVVDGAFIVYNGLVVPKYSRNNESEADRLSMEYMARAGFDPAAAVRLWKRAYEKEGAEPGYMSILSTHPSNKARYEALERQLASVQIDRGTPLSMPAPPSTQTGTVAAKPSTPKTEPAKPTATKTGSAKALITSTPASAPSATALPKATSLPYAPAPPK